MSYLINLENVSRIYEIGNNKIYALRDASLRIKCGEMTAIVGTSGSGKSTLMNIIGFLDRATSGRYFFNELDVSTFSDDQLASIRNQEIGFVFQSFFLLPRLTAIQNVVLPLFYRGIHQDDSKRMAQAMLDKVGVGHLAYNRPNQLSGGQQQRVAIARALVGDPKVILADEPTGALDSDTGNDVMQLFTDLNRNEGKTIVIITHDNEISRRCERVVKIKDGILI